MAQRLLSLLLRVYPKDFRRRFGVGLTYALRQEHNSAKGRGLGALVGFWSSTLWDVASGGLQEHFSGRGADGPRATRLEMEVKRDWGGGEMIGQMIGDFALALRRLGKRPGFAFAGIATMGLGLGGATAIFSVLHTVILRPLAYEDPAELVWIGHSSDQSTLGVPSGGYIEYRDRSRTISELAIYTEGTTTMRIGNEPTELGVIRTTPELFSLLGVQAALGRTFVDEDIVVGGVGVGVGRARAPPDSRWKLNGIGEVGK
jgi:hypothetical protein